MGRMGSGWAVQASGIIFYRSVIWPGDTRQGPSNENWTPGQGRAGSKVVLVLNPLCYQ